MVKHIRKRRRYRPRLTSAGFYGIRRAALQTLGFTSYLEYLDSQLWRDVRTSLLKNRGWECELCGDEATQVHHQHYGVDDLSGNRFDYLVAICAGCHHCVEFDSNGKKRSAAGVLRQCNKMMNAYRRKLRNS